MIAISTMMTTAFRCFFAFTQLPATKATVPSSRTMAMVVDDSSKISGPALPRKQAAKRTIEEEDVEQPRKRRKTLHNESKPVEQTPVAELTNALCKLKISVDHTDDATAVQDLTSAFRKLTLFTVDEYLARSFAKLAISTDKGNDETTAPEKVIAEDQIDIDSGFMMELDDEDDDKTDIDDDNDDMDIDSGYMMDVDDDDETERMDTTD